MFDDQFIDALPDDKIKAAHVMCERFFEISNYNLNNDDPAYEEYLEAFAAFTAFCNARALDFKAPKLEGSREGNLDLIRQFFGDSYSSLDKMLTQVTLTSAREKFLMKFGGAPTYEFSESDLDIIQKKINELRAALNGSQILLKEHKERLLTRLESLQAEFHKKMSSLDKFWSFAGDAGMVLGKFGEDAKPLFDRVRELVEAVTGSQNRPRELAEEVSKILLPDKNDE